MDTQGLPSIATQ